MTPKQREGDSAVLSIGALAQATGISALTLRAWESRYGFPTPHRTPKGHRLYVFGDVERLAKISTLLAAGLRPHAVVGLPPAALEDALARLGEPADGARDASPSAPTPMAELLDAVANLDAERLTAALTLDAERLEPLTFVVEQVAPLLEAIGEAWGRGEIGVRHEHLLTDRVGAILGALRLRHEARARGPQALFTTLPGESHSLGLQMAALTFALAGWRVVYLGAQVPLDELATIGRELPVVAVGVSAASLGAPVAGAIRRLRAQLPDATTLVTGGAGAPEPEPGVTRITDLRVLHAWATARRGEGEGEGGPR